LSAIPLDRPQSLTVGHEVTTQAAKYVIPAKAVAHADNEPGTSVVAIDGFVPVLEQIGK
jgi:hypothetical protein